MIRGPGPAAQNFRGSTGEYQGSKPVKFRNVRIEGQSTKHTDENHISIFMKMNFVSTSHHPYCIFVIYVYPLCTFGINVLESITLVFLTNLLETSVYLAGLCRGCVLGTFTTLNMLKSGMSPIILAVGAHVPTNLRLTNGNINQVTPEKLPMSPYFSMLWVICPHFSKALAEHWPCI